MLSLQRYSGLRRRSQDAKKKDENIKSVVTADKLLFRKTAFLVIKGYGSTSNVLETHEDRKDVDAV